MEYILVSTGLVVFIVVALMLLGKASDAGPRELLDWKPARDYDTEAQLEQDDIAQMLAAQNEYRKRRGAKELTERDAERMAAEDNAVRDSARSLEELEVELRDDGS